MSLPCGHPDECAVTPGKSEYATSFCGYCVVEEDVKYWKMKVAEANYISAAQSTKIKDLEMQLEEYKALYRGYTK